MDNPSQVEQIGASVAVYGTVYAAVLLYSAAQLLRLWPEPPDAPSEPPLLAFQTPHLTQIAVVAADSDRAGGRTAAATPNPNASKSPKPKQENDLQFVLPASHDEAAESVERNLAATRSPAEIARRRRARRLEWAACFALCLHTAAAFHFHHGWSHDRAVAATARQTEEILGLGFGGGIFFNYALLILWPLALVLEAFSLSNGRRCCSQFVTIVNIYVAFLFFQGVVVFGQGMVRIWGLLVTLAAILLLLRRRRKH